MSRGSFTFRRPRGRWQGVLWAVPSSVARPAACWGQRGQSGVVSLASAKTQSPSYWRTSCSRPDSNAGWRGWGWAFVGGFAPVWPSVPIVLPLVCVCVWGDGRRRVGRRREEQRNRLMHWMPACVSTDKLVTMAKLKMSQGYHTIYTHTSHGWNATHCRSVHCYRYMGKFHMFSFSGSLSYWLSCAFTYSYTFHALYELPN